MPVPTSLGSETRLMAARADAYAAKHETLERAVEARRSELRTAGAELGRLRNGSTLLRQQLEAVTQLADRGLYPKLKLVQLQQQASDAEGELKKTEAGLAAAQAALAESQSRLAGLEKDWHSQVLTELSDGDGRARSAQGAERRPAWAARRAGGESPGGGRGPGSRRSPLPVSPSGPTSR